MSQEEGQGAAGTVPTPGIPKAFYLQKKWKKPRVRIWDKVNMLVRAVYAQACAGDACLAQGPRELSKAKGPLTRATTGGCWRSGRR